MGRHQFSMVLALLALSAAQAAQPVSSPIVVYRGAKSVSAAPYIQAFSQRQKTTPAREHSRATTGVTPLVSRLPLAPKQLTVGSPTVRRTQAPVNPFFVMGMDRTSLDWLAQMLPSLLRINATGMVIQASHRADWQALQSKARASGLSLALYPDTGLTSAYGLTTYPVLVLPRGIDDRERKSGGAP